MKLTEDHFFILWTYAEFFLVAAIIITTYFIYFYYKSKNLTYRFKLNKTILYFEALIRKKDIPLQIPRMWVRITILANAVKHFDNLELDSSSHWWDIKEEIMNRYLLPLARKEAYSSTWHSRLLAGKAFNLSPKQCDEDIILKLLGDENIRVALECNDLITKLPTEKILNAVIDNMSENRKNSYELYLYNFYDIPTDSQHFIVERLIHEKKPLTRAICYRILMRYDPIIYNLDATPDAFSPSLQLSLTTIRFIAYIQKLNSIPLLITLLSDKRWQVRVAALQDLAQLNAVAALLPVSYLLSDNHKWVRINAANALKQLGSSGLDLLHFIERNPEHPGYDEVKYVLQTPNYKDEK